MNLGFFKISILKLSLNRTFALLNFSCGSTGLYTSEIGNNIMQIQPVTKKYRFNPNSLSKYAAKNGDTVVIIDDPQFISPVAKPSRLLK
jgi:hypothetical protein